MERELTKMVDDAAQIRTSGRWAAINANIESMAAMPGEGNEWYVQVLGGLLSQVFTEYIRLEQVYEENGDTNISTLAWHARNLLELWVWSLYSTTTRENARRLYEDSGRDIVGMSKAYRKHLEATAELNNLCEQLSLTEESLRLRAASEGIDSLDGSYKRVDEAAKECGVGPHYSLFFKLASKFAHPTAMLMLASPDKLIESRLGDFFFSEGCLFFSEAFAALENHLLRRTALS
jgi:hypothetical protein